MMKKKEIYIHTRIKQEDEDAIKKICEITGKSKTDTIRRLIQNEFNLLTNKPELIIDGCENITDRRFQRLFDKLNELQQDVDEVHTNTDKRLKEINSIARKIFGALLFCNRDIHRNYFIISRLLYDQFKIAKEKVESYVNKSIVSTGHSMRDTIKLLDWDLKRIADFFDSMGKDIKTEDLK
jgi:hypothetical protein